MKHLAEIALNDSAFLVVGLVLGWLFGATAQRKAIAELIKIKETANVDAQFCLDWIKAHLGLK